MKKVTYRGSASRAAISSADWKAVGVNSKDAEWNGYGDEVELADDAAAYLAEKDDRFEVEGAGDGSAYGRRLASSPTEQLNRERVGTRGGVAPVRPSPSPSGAASRTSDDDS